MNSQHNQTGSVYYCQVCNSEFIHDTRNGSCIHMCIACEVTLLQCPVCITKTVGNESISKEDLNEAISNILIAQQQRANDMAAEVKNPQVKKSLKTQILKHCFLGVWDGTLNFVLKAVGVKSSKKNPVLGNVQNIIARVGRQTGRSVFPNVCDNLSSVTSMKLLGGFTALLICIQMVIARKHAK